MQAKSVGGSGSVKNPLEADLNFATYKAVAMVCDNGATLPSTPVIGQWFLHTPTGRNILMQYDGSNWISIISMGTMTIYVDSTDGTDDTAHGTAADASAFKTFQYAINSIPAIIGGNVVINVNAESYAEDVVFRGHNLAGNYSVKIYGTLSAQETWTSTSKVAGTTSTQGSVTKEGQFAGNTYANMLVYDATDDVYRVIDSHTDDAITIAGSFTTATAGSNTVYDWGTKVNTFSIYSTKVPIDFYGVEFVTNTSSVTIDQGVDSVNFYYCKFDGALSCYDFSMGRIYDCIFLSGSIIVAQLNSGYFATAFVYRGKFDHTQNSKKTVYAYNLGIVRIMEGTIFYGHNTTGSTAIYAAVNGIVQISNTTTYLVINDYATGIYAYSGGKVIGTANNTYKSNTADETADAASFGYID